MSKLGEWDVGGWPKSVWGEILTAPLRFLYVLFMLLLLTVASAFGQLRVSSGVRAQTTGPCGTGVAHCTTLFWTASTTGGVTYNVFRGTTSGSEGAVPINVSPITGLTYIDPVTLTNQQQTFFYYVEAVETSSFGTLNSVPSNEVSATFPAIPQAPTGATATPH